MEKNPWEGLGGIGGYYVGEFRRNLDEVAKLLGAKTRFNPERKCAELHVSDDWSEKVIARVNVTGECCTALNAEITSQQELPDTTKELFGKALSRLKVRYEVRP